MSARNIRHKTVQAVNINLIAERTHVKIVTSPGAVIRLGKALKKFGFEKRKSNGLFLWAIQERSPVPSIC
jgi:hypothetical protein